MIDSYKYTFHHENEIALLKQMLKGQRWDFYIKVDHPKKRKSYCCTNFKSKGC